MTVSMGRSFFAAFFALIQLIAFYTPAAAAIRPPGGPGLRNGQWRAQLQRKDGNSIVFNFEVKDSAGKKILYIRNAGESLLVDEIRVTGDSVLIRLPFFESQLRAALTEKGNLEGVWLKHLADGYQSVPFSAEYNVPYRFMAAGRPHQDLTGRWKASFRSPGSAEVSERVGEFTQSGSRITGTFLDPTGDFRWLEGVVDGDSLKLSCFDGGHAYLFTARVDATGNLTGGQYFAGATGLETWTAEKDAGASLPDEFSLTKWNKDAGPLHFTYRDLQGKNVSLSDARFKGKVVLIQIMGSWCPNCMDETNFLSGFYDQYHSKGVEIIGLAYERSTDFARSQTSLRSFQQRFHVKYPILITGVAVGDPQRAEKTLPQLEKIVGFPTTIFVGRTGHIEKIHTGFSGPGTGEHYESQKKEFYETVDGLLKGE
jgi:thiol-disulfide isomerase/thioredoxin